MGPTSKSLRKLRGPLRVTFMVSPVSAGSFVIGRHGFLIGRNGERIHYTVRVCSLTGKGIMELDVVPAMKRA